MVSVEGGLTTGVDVIFLNLKQKLIPKDSHDKPEIREKYDQINADARKGILKSDIQG